MPTRKESHQAPDFWCLNVSQEGCLANQKVPWFGKASADCATFEDDNLLCSSIFIYFFN